MEKILFFISRMQPGKSPVFCHIKICAVFCCCCFCCFINFGTLGEDETCSMTILEEQQKVLGMSSEEEWDSANFQTFIFLSEICKQCTSKIIYYVQSTTFDFPPKPICLTIFLCFSKCKLHSISCTLPSPLTLSFSHILIQCTN